MGSQAEVGGSSESELADEMLCDYTQDLGRKKLTDLCQENMVHLSGRGRSRDEGAHLVTTSASRLLSEQFICRHLWLRDTFSVLYRKSGSYISL